MNLTELTLHDSYSSDENDIVNDFYNPVLECAISYERITGYFSPSILAVASRGFAGIINNDGKIKILTSIQVNADTYKAIHDSGVNTFNEDLFDKVNLDLDQLKTELERNYLKVFIHLYKLGKIELRVAILRDREGILHQKVGIVSDAEGNAISFSGSNNETIGGVINNVEEFKVFKNWIISSSPYFANDQSKFNKYWNNRVDGVKVVEISDAVKQKIVKLVDDNENVDEVIKKIRSIEAKKDEGSETLKNSERELRGYQKKAIAHWSDNNYKSIFEMATGTGKTFTAINALREFKDDKGYLHCVAVVPLATLTIQWEVDIRKILSGVTVINTSTNSKWKEELNNVNLSNKLGRSIDYILITTYAMFTKKDFSERIESLGEGLVLLADEMHNLVNKNRLAALSNPAYTYKLGLSATPTRLWNQYESTLVRQHFGDNSFVYDLSDAIKSGFLVKYNYHPLPIFLENDEFEKYVDLSKAIGRLFQSGSKVDEDNSPLSSKLRERARIKKNAFNKLVALDKTIKELQKSKSFNDALIYVENEDKITELQKVLTDNLIRTTKFTGDNTLEERLSAIDNLRKKSINAIVAIKCLDEGVDIPSAQQAFFLSNNTDPREYVQRLGRVLRLDKESGKEIAEIYDYIVMPPSDVVYEDDAERKIARNMIKNELIRSKFFNELSSNSEQAQEIIDDAVDRFGFYFEDDELNYTVGEPNEFTD